MNLESLPRATILTRLLLTVERMADFGHITRTSADTICQAIRYTMPLPADVARCVGEYSKEDGEYHWREGCEDCQRRTSPGGRVTVEPPAIIVFECEYRIGPEEVVG